MLPSTIGARTTASSDRRQIGQFKILCMSNDTIGADRENAVGGWLIAFHVKVHPIKEHGHLTHETFENGERHAAVATGYCAVDVACDDVADGAVTFDQVVESGAVAKFYGIHSREPRVMWRMVHEENCGAFGEFSIEPGHSVGA